ncbi:hypothetical protein [Caballeronia hypogeia]|uniref:hypothetical protein n=1 Tax=Caballeronia hypogeia TaxID=1777140 RepID=UPI0012FE2018|nr:hypothetical protein [Caballeronia hypogeia]
MAAQLPPSDFGTQFGLSLVVLPAFTNPDFALDTSSEKHVRQHFAQRIGPPGDNCASHLHVDAKGGDLDQHLRLIERLQHPADSFASSRTRTHANVSERDALIKTITNADQDLR